MHGMTKAQADAEYSRSKSMAMEKALDDLVTDKLLEAWMEAV